MTTVVPLLVPWPLASRHLLPFTVNCRFAVYVQRWLAPPWQSHNCTWVPFVDVAPGTSTQRPDAVPTIVTFAWPGGGLVGGGELGGGLVSPKEEMNCQASVLVHVLAPSSHPEQPSTGAGPWPPSNAAQRTG